ncbi:hypothetical protein AB0B78_11050 [Streptomyces sp. NPDC040724]|uniref:hypothetical protein n=1 Tax=Streptomyces sp. NPDC040724 TaxID=3155612 RepID=UPI0033F60904
MTGLQEITTRREGAVVLITAAKQHLLDGRPDEAKTTFEEALRQDRDSTAAASGVAEAAALTHRTFSTAPATWDRFYRDWVATLGRCLLFGAIAVIVLMAASGLLSRVVVRVDAVEWHKPVRHTAVAIGLTSLLGTALLFPLYTTFTFTAGTPLVCAAGITAAAVAVSVPVLVLIAQRRHEVTWKHWLRLFIAVTVAAAVALVLWLTALDTSAERVLVAYTLLAVLGVLLTAAALGQNLRLQVEAQAPDGTVNAAATEYLLARMTDLGSESPKSLRRTNALTNASLSTITSETLSALPAGPFASTISRLFFALRPDLTWRAQVTLVDSDRVAMSMSRNGRHAESAIFSRPDLGLRPLPAAQDDEGQPTPARDRARAQLLTGAAAFILLHLSEAHPELKYGLCGARNWKAVALQVISRSKALSGDGPDANVERLSLLGRAVNEDPGYLLARFEYLWTSHYTAPKADAGYRSLAAAIDDHYESTGLKTKDPVDESWGPLRIRILYNSATQWLNAYMESDPKDQQALARAKESSDTLSTLCEREYQGRRLSWFAGQMRPFAATLKHGVEVLSPPHETSSEKNGGDQTDSQTSSSSSDTRQTDPMSPKLAYDRACFYSFRALHECPEKVGLWIDEAIKHLYFALTTDGDKEDAAKDPCFRPIQSDDRFRRLVRAVPPATFLDLPSLAAHRAALEEVGITTPLDLAARTQTARQSDQLAAHLKVSEALVDRYRDLALLASIHPALADAALLHLLESVDIRSPHALRTAARNAPGALMRDLRKQAADTRVGPPALSVPSEWLIAAGADRRKAVACDQPQQEQ